MNRNYLFNGGVPSKCLVSQLVNDFDFNCTLEALPNALQIATSMKSLPGQWVIFIQCLLDGKPKACGACHNNLSSSLARSNQIASPSLDLLPL
jgi:hypothetical protein